MFRNCSAYLPLHPCIVKRYIYIYIANVVQACIVSWRKILLSEEGGIARAINIVLLRKYASRVHERYSEKIPIR